jgi:nicotinic acid phosphoribosyltransferase
MPETESKPPSVLAPAIQVPFSLLDNDLYKFSMQQAVLKVYPDAIVTYQFKNRKPDQFKFTLETVSYLRQRISGTDHTLANSARFEQD